LRNQKIKIAVFPFQNDYYGATDSIIAVFLKFGFQVVERAELYRVFDEMKLQMSGITEYEQIQAGKILNVDRIILGSVYTKYVPYYPSNSPPATDPYSAFASGFVEGLNRGQAGTYIYANIRTIDPQTGQVLSADTDVFIRKQ